MAPPSLLSTKLPNETAINTSASDLSDETLAGRRLAKAPPGEEVCITGITGKFPECDNVHDLRDGLFNKKNFISSDDRRWNRATAHPDLPKGGGLIEGLPKFDASFFGFHLAQAEGADPITRIILEKSYEVIVDAGVNPVELRGTRTGVFVGACFSESEPNLFLDVKPVNGSSLLGSTRFSYAQRVAYWLQTNGPCYSVDSACSSSMHAMDQAYKAIRDGDCDQAIVAGASLCLRPNLAMQFLRLGVLSDNGCCKTFDEDADGYGRSEAIAALFLQKSRDARRVYATIVYSKTNNDGFKEQGITFPSSKLQKELLSKFYVECEIDPSTLGWVEAHGTGTKVGDPEECSALVSVFCKGRDKPLPIGSIKSNLGHTEPVSGLCSITKAVIAMETGLIPPNINFNRPKQSVSGLVEGRLQVVTDAQAWEGGLVGINSFGFGGSNAHVCLRWNDKKKVDGGSPRDQLTRLVVVSGRTERGVRAMIDDLCSHPVDAELAYLYHKLGAHETPGHVYRGYVLLKQSDSFKHVQVFDKQPRPIWLSFTAMESQSWPGMGDALAALPPFASALSECQAALDACKLPTPLSLRNLLGAGSLDNLKERILASVVVQIGLAAILRAVGVAPVSVSGSGSGALAAGYAAGCLTAGQAFRAAICLGVAREQGVDGQEKILTGMLGQILPIPVSRPSCWTGFETSVSAESLSRALLTLSDPKDLVRHAPRNGVVLHASGDLNDSIEKNKAMKIALMKRGGDEVEQLLQALGKLYVAGVNNGAGLALAELYPQVSLPVSRGTPMIAPHVDWEHSRDWYTDFYAKNLLKKTQEITHVINVEKNKFEFYKGHVIDGRNLFPATGYLFLVWNTLLGISTTDSKIIFENVRFHRATTLPPTGNLELFVSIHKSSGKFEVMEGDTKVVTGRIYFDTSSEKKERNIPLPEYSETAQEENITMTAKEIYKELRLRGYNYSGLFKGLVSADLVGCRGKIRWANDWVAFMDNMLQIHILHADTRDLFVPTGIGRMTVDATKHLRIVRAKIEQEGETDPVLDLEVIKEAGLIRSGGIEIVGLAASSITLKKHNAVPVLESYQFLPYKTGTKGQWQLPLDLALRTCVHVGLENCVGCGVQVKVAELLDSEHKGEPLGPIVAAILADLPLLKADIMLLSAADESSLEKSLSPLVRIVNSPIAKQESCVFVLASRVLGRPDVLKDSLAALAPGGFLLARELPETQPESDFDLDVLRECLVNDEKFVLLRKRCPLLSYTIIRVDESGEWIAGAQEALRDCKKSERVVLFAQNEPLTGLLGAFNCLNKEHSGQNARCVLILDETAPPFDITLPFYRDQLTLDLMVNVYSQGSWGSYRHLPLGQNPEVSVTHAYANTTTRGDLSSFRWLEGSLCSPGPLPVASETVHVYYSALNFRDVMLASGKLKMDVVGNNRLRDDCFQGLEFSGRTEDGRRIMGITATCSQATKALALSDFLWEVPDEWSLEDAATVPIVYATVMCAMQTRGEMRRGESILIHSGTGGVGQAAIHLALHEGLTVYTTVGTDEKRDFIKKLFPSLKDSQIGNSRDTSFEQLVMRETNGRGVDLVLNSLAEEKLQASLRCLAVGGRFLEIGKFDLASNNEIGMDLFLKEITFHGVMVDMLLEIDSELRKPLHDLVEKGIREGYVLPLARTTFPAEEVEQAYRFMGTGKHMGKVLLKIRDEEDKKIVLPTPTLMKATPRFSCQERGTYIVVGGLGGFGLELADWLVLRGARHIVLVSHSGLRNGYQTSRIRAWRSYGVDVLVSLADIQTEEGVVDLLTSANAMGPVSGIFNLAVVLQDALFENQTPERFAVAAGPKALATRLLDTASRRLCPNLEQFVVFSSVSCGRGNAGQTSYGAANSTMERICEQRAREGLPALAVQWGAVGQVGLVADMRDDDKEIVIGGTLPQRIASCLAALDGFLRQKLPIVASMVVAEKVESGPKDSMLDRVAFILGIQDLKKVSFQRTLAELGMDSMTAVEIKQTLEREYQVVLSPTEIRRLTFARVAELSADETQPSEGDMELNHDGIAQLTQNLGNERTGYATTVSLSTRLTPSLSTSDGRTLLMIPGLEGMASGLEPLAQNLDAKAVCLQGDWWTDRSETVLGMAQMLLPHAQRELAESTEFLLLGYSFGGLVSLHLAAMLEADGRRGKLFLVDGAPDYLQQLQKAVAVDDSEAGIEADLIIGMVNLMHKQVGVSNEIRESILALPSWTERLDFALTLIPEAMFDRKYLRDVGNATLRRARAVSKFDWPVNQKIESPVTLLRPTYKNLKLPLDLGLNKYCKSPADVHLFDETHVSILGSTQMATIINEQMTRSSCEERRR